MTSFLATCLRALSTSVDVTLHTVELKLCTSLATQVSNWSLDLEQCPVELSWEQACRLYDGGVENLVN